MAMALVADIVTVIEELAPSAWAEKWDNAGLQVGSLRHPVDKVFVAVDPTTPVVRRAIEVDAQLLITHHPLLFQPLRSLDLDTPLGRLVALAIGEGISIYSAHTNLDMVPGGVNTALAERLDLSVTQVLEEAQPHSFKDMTFDVHPLEGRPKALGYGCIGDLAGAAPFEQFVDCLKKGLGISYLQMAGRPPAEVSRVALCGGSGSGFMERAHRAGADLFITSELKHSHARAAEELDFCVLDIGHFHSEKFGVTSLARFLRKRLSDKGLDVTVIEDQKEDSPFQLIN